MVEIQKVSSLQTPDGDRVLRFLVQNKNASVTVERKRGGKVSVHWPTEVDRFQFLVLAIADSFIKSAPYAEIVSGADDNQTRKRINSKMRITKLLRSSTESSTAISGMTTDPSNWDFIAIDSGEYEVTWENERNGSEPRNEMTVLFKEKPTSESNHEDEHTNIGYLNKLRSFYVEVLEKYIQPDTSIRLGVESQSINGDTMEAVRMLLILPWDVLSQVPDNTAIEDLRQELKQHFNSEIISRIEEGEYKGAYWDHKKDSQGGDVPSGIDKVYSSESDSGIEKTEAEALKQEALEKLRIASEEGSVETGRRSTRKAIDSGDAELVYLARDETSVSHLAEVASRERVPYIYVDSSNIIQALSNYSIHAVATIIDPGEPAEKFNNLRKQILQHNKDYILNDQPQG